MSEVCQEAHERESNKENGQNSHARMGSERIARFFVAPPRSAPAHLRRRLVSRPNYFAFKSDAICEVDDVGRLCKTRSQSELALSRLNPE